MALVAVAAGLVYWAAQPKMSDQPNTSVVLDQLADQTLESVMRVVTPAVERTQRIAGDDAIHQALTRRDADTVTSLINERVRHATEVDVVLVFDADGEILSINTVYADGSPVPQDRVDAVMSRSFEKRDIIQSCTRNNHQSQALEFQTGCDVTPAYFDSSGLSVAYSVPIVDPQTGERIGVVSTRLRFERVLELLGDPEQAEGFGRAYFVTDRGGYFDESINAGEEQSPIPSEDLQKLTAQLAEGVVSQAHARMTVDNESKHIGLYRLGDVQTLDDGGINLMLSIDHAWLMREARQAALIRALSLVVLLVLVSGAAAWMYCASRHRRAMAVTISELRAAEASRDQSQRQLIDASRRAGMAEIATGVLHNVGNVLNSVNTSGQTITQRTRQLPVEHLQKSVGLIREHEDDLDTFFKTDAKGSRLPGFLDQLANVMQAEQGEILGEMDKLRARLDHIRHIIDAQQDDTASAVLTQNIVVRELIDQAVEINACSNEDDGVEFILELQGPDTINSDPHLIMQVLVNLLNNARRAVLQSSRTSKQILIVARPGEVHGAPAVVILVRDNGVGIDPDHLRQIFQHGFTTQKDGHGFGLHSSANAAHTLGGTLTADSNGLGLGAEFTLTLPVTAPSPQTSIAA